jgi:hypothetical protein
MKLAEALILRADAQTRLTQLRDRLVKSALVQEGDKPPEDPGALIQEVERVSTTLLGLVQKINRTNMSTELSTGVTLADALAERDVLLLQRGIYASLAEAGSASQSRYSRSEVKFVSTVKVSDIRERADELSKERRELDARIQAANWNVDLIE